MLRQLTRPSFTVLVAAVSWVAACETPPTPGDGDRLGAHGAAPTPPSSATSAAPTSAAPTSAAPTPAAPTQAKARPKPIVSGELAPRLALPDVETGALWSLEAYLDPTGESSPKGFLIAYMASWCQYCTQSLPTLVALERDNPDLAVVTVTVDDTPAARKAELAKVRAAGLTGPVLAADADAVATWVGGGKSVPHYYFVDHDGRVVAQDQGFGDTVEPRMPEQAARALRD